MGSKYRKETVEEHSSSEDEEIILDKKKTKKNKQKKSNNDEYTKKRKTVSDSIVEKKKNSKKLKKSGSIDDLNKFVRNRSADSLIMDPKKKINSKNLILIDTSTDESSDDEQNTTVSDKKTTETVYDNDNIMDMIDMFDDSEIEKIESNKNCDECGGIDCIIDNNEIGALVCSECGYIVKQILNNTAEWNNYQNDDGNTSGVNRCNGMTNELFQKSSIGTVILGGNKNLAKRQGWQSMAYKDKSLKIVIDKIMKICEDNKIKKIVADTAIHYFKKISESKKIVDDGAERSIITRGGNRIAVIGACLYFACKKNRSPMDVQEVSKMFGIEKSKLTVGCNQLRKFMETTDENKYFDDIDSNSPEHFIKRRGTNLKIPEKYIDLAIRMGRNCTKLKIVADHNPQSISAGILMVVIDKCELPFTRTVIAKAFSTSEVTVTKICKKIEPFAEIIFSDELTDLVIKKNKVFVR